jgi:glycosyltransferase involved in cell wall biosynthesis
MAVHRSVSVVVPSYNRAQLLPLTLDAILAQTSPAEEVIVVDDGSTDGTPDMVRQRFDGRVRLQVIPNSGDLAARNLGTSLAAGDLVAFCDSDDLWEPGFLAAMRDLWRAEPAMRAGYANFHIVRGGRWEARDKFADAPAGFWEGMRELGGPLAAFDRPILDRLIRFQPFFPSCLVADRRFLLEIGGWDESVARVVGTDFATALRLAEHAPLGVVRRPLVGIRKHDGNFSADVQRMNLGDAEVLERILPQRPALAPFAAEIRASIARRRRDALDTAFARRDFRAVREIEAMLPGPARGAQRAKALVARLPRPLSGLAARAMLGLGSLRAATLGRSSTG